jgi:hypothetical protein
MKRRLILRTSAPDALGFGAPNRGLGTSGLVLLLALFGCVGDLKDSARQNGGDRNQTDSDGGTPADDTDPNADPHQRCVDRINALRATLKLAPLMRWKDAEDCSDMQSQQDLGSGEAHGNFGECMEHGQNTCPGWPGGVNAIIGGCLDAMWSEGPADQDPCNGACFQKHGHYLNMTSTGNTKVACGFYTDDKGNTWSNQNFN